MAPSQLKQLRQSLRENGLLGPTRSNKKGKAAHNQSRRDDLQKATALADIRDKARPFDVQMAARPQKFQVTTAKSMKEQGKKQPVVLGRPGVTRSKGEELRRKTLLLDLQSRAKVGGIIDRRIGENNAQMTHEERLHQRLIREASSKRKGTSLFDLENDENEFTLTHHGAEIDFDALGSEIDDDEPVETGDRPLKRPLDESGTEDGDDDGHEAKPERKKSKAEVMKEVIAKSKFHKMERQMAQEQDMALIAELDKRVPDLFKELSGLKPREVAPITARPTVTHPPPRPVSTGANSVPVGGAPVQAEPVPASTSEDKNKAYDMTVKELATDAKAKPTVRTKTEEELAEEYAQWMKKLEADRLRRMNGEIVPVEGQKGDMMEVDEEDKQSDDGDAAEFGFKPQKLDERFDDEDEFLLEDGLVASDDEDLDISGDESDERSDSDDDDVDADDDASFTAGFADDTLETYVSPPGMMLGDDGLTIPCPTTHAELLGLLEGGDITHLPKTIQQIRAMYGGTLPERREKLGKFAGVLVDHLHYLGSQKPAPPPIVIDQMIRHLQSMARNFAVSIAVAARTRLDEMVKPVEGSEGAANTTLTPGDLLVLTAIGTVFSTSDQFHPVALPAMTVMTRWLSLHSPPKSRQDVATGSFLVQLALKYQTKAKRYVPECVNFATEVIERSNGADEAVAKGAGSMYGLDLVDQLCGSVAKMAELWADKPSFVEIFSTRALPALESRVRRLNGVIKREQSESRRASQPGEGSISTPTSSSSTSTPLESVAASVSKTGSVIQKVRILVSNSRLGRRTLELHHHRPRPIRTYIPRFEDNFDPDKHYDPDRARAELAKLRAEHKRERKGAIRDLRKDANFLARQQLAAKVVADRAYHDKMRRLVAEVQGEEGHEKNAYERERKMRKMKR